MPGRSTPKYHHFIPQMHQRNFTDAEGATEAEILADFDELAPEDIEEAMLFAARSIGHPVLRVA
jgi:hypothetical protein